MSSVPGGRIRVANDAVINGEGDYVLYWMVAFRRTTWNFSLQRARELAHELGKPLLIFEPLRSDYHWASDRLHQFVFHGMAQNARRLKAKAVSYYPYLEPSHGAGKGLLRKLAKRACAVISDDYPCFFLPRMIAAATRQIPVRFELVDSNGLLPLRTADKVFARAYDFRRYLQKNLRTHLDDFPEEDPLYRRRLPRLKSLPRDITQKWPPANVKQLATHPEHFADFPVDHDVAPTSLPGGTKAASAQLDNFLQYRIQHYLELRNEPEQEVTSGLSPYLHFGHISAHEVFRRIIDHAGWSTTDISDRSNGSSTGWWGTSAEVESFLDELITWRELGFNMCASHEDYDRYESLPEWALKTLSDHAADRREHTYDLEEFENALTHDALWNAAQRQLIREGRIHNYMRMLWGKKILHWSPSPQQALDTMIELNNKYALDGRDPNSYSGIFWCLGRYDRPWGPERQIFGKVRYMSCDNAARKFRLDGYLRKFGDEPQLELPL